MEAHLSKPLYLTRGLLTRRHAIATAILTGTAAVLCLGLLVIGRRLAGAVVGPAPVWLLIPAAAANGVFSWLSRRLWRTAVLPREAASRRIADMVVCWGPSLAMVLLTFGLSGRMERQIDWLVWLPLWVADVLWRKAFMSGEPLEGLRRDAAAPAASMADPVEPATPDVVVQQLTRFRDADGRDSIAGLVRAEFVAGQRTAEVYVGFCPAFLGMPTVECEQSDGPPARISVGQALPHGSRIDVRLDNAAVAAEHVLVDIFACL